MDLYGQGQFNLCLFTWDFVLYVAASQGASEKDLRQMKYETAIRDTIYETEGNQSIGYARACVVRPRGNSRGCGQLPGGPHVSSGSGERTKGGH